MSTDAAPAPSSDAQVRTLRPQPKAYRHLLLLAVAAGILAALRGARRSELPLEWYVGSGLAVAAVAAAWATLWYRNARVWSDGTALHRRTAFGRVHTVPHADVATVLLAPEYRWPRSHSSGLLAFLDREGAALLRLTGRRWDEDQLRAFAGVTGVPVDLEEDAVRRRDLLDSHPGALPWIVRHEWAVVGVLVGTAVLIAVALLLAGT